MDNKITVRVAAAAWPYSPGHAAFGWITERNGVAFHKAAVYMGSSVTQDTAEYAALVSVLSWMDRISKVLKVQTNPINLKLIPVVIDTNNLMIVKQIIGAEIVKPPFFPMCETARQVMSLFRIIEIRHVPKTQIRDAAELARGVLTKMGYQPGPD
jgi:hypothetical protein